MTTRIQNSWKSGMIFFTQSMWLLDDLQKDLVDEGVGFDS